MAWPLTAAMTSLGVFSMRISTSCPWSAKFDL